MQIRVRVLLPGGVKHNVKVNVPGTDARVFTLLIGASEELQKAGVNTEVDFEGAGISLNGTSRLDCTQESRLSALGVCPGDLVYILVGPLAAAAAAAAAATSAGEMAQASSTSSARQGQSSASSATVSALGSHHGSRASTSETPEERRARAAAAAEKRLRIDKPEATESASGAVGAPNPRLASTAAASHATAMETESETETVGAAGKDSAEADAAAAPLVREGVELSPQSALLEFHASNPSHYVSDQEALSLAAHVAMLQSAFVPGEGTEGHDRLSSDAAFGARIPQGWNKVDLCSFTYRPPVFWQDGSANIKCMLMGGKLLIYGTVSASHGFSMKRWNMSVALSQYVARSSPTSLPTFRNINTFLKVFKDTISHRMLSELRERAGLPQENCLSTLVPELKLIVLSFLDPISLCRAACVDREFRAMVATPSLWRRLYLRVFRDPNARRIENWRRAFQERYERERAQRQRMEHHHELIGLPPRWGVVPQPAPYSPLYDPFGSSGAGMGGFGIIGGDYDLGPSFPAVPGGGQQYFRPPGFGPQGAQPPFLPPGPRPPRPRNPFGGAGPFL